MYKQGQAFGVCLADEVYQLVRATAGGAEKLMVLDD